MGPFLGVSHRPTVHGSPVYRERPPLREWLAKKTLGHHHRTQQLQGMTPGSLSSVDYQVTESELSSPMKHNLKKKNLTHARIHPSANTPWILQERKCRNTKDVYKNPFQTDTCLWARGKGFYSIK